MLILQTVWQDNNRREAYPAFYLDPNQSIPEAIVTANQIISAMEAVSNAVITRAYFKIVPELSISNPNPFGGNAYERGIILFTDGEDTHSVSIVSPDNLPYDVDGPYRDIRVFGPSLLLPAVQALNDAIRLYSVRRDGSPIPGNIRVIGRTKNQ